MEIRRGEGFDSSLKQALQHPYAPSEDEFDSELLPIIGEVGERWAQLFPHRENPYRRTLFHVGHLVPICSLQACLRPNGVIELERFSIDWDFPPGPGDE